MNIAVLWAEIKNAACFRRRHQVANISVGGVPKIVTVVCGGRLLTFDGMAEPVLRFIFNASKFTKQELLAASNGASWDAVYGVLLPLLREGFITCE